MNQIKNQNQRKTLKLMLETQSRNYHTKQFVLYTEFVLTPLKHTGYTQKRCLKLSNLLHEKLEIFFQMTKSNWKELKIHIFSLSKKILANLKFFWRSKLSITLRHRIIINIYFVEFSVSFRSLLPAQRIRKYNHESDSESESEKNFETHVGNSLQKLSHKKVRFEYIARLDSQETFSKPDTRPMKIIS